MGGTPVALGAMQPLTFTARLFGVAGADRLAGGDGDDVISGLAGDDVLLKWGDEVRCLSTVRAVTRSPRGLGRDVLNGGPGIEDNLDYSVHVAPITLTLCVDTAAPTGVGSCENPRNDGLAGEGDAVLNIEVVEGGRGNDTNTGASADEWIHGNGGDDVIDGGGGNDHLDGNASINTLTGGSGADICQHYVQATARDLHVYICNVDTKRHCDRAPENACETDTATSPTNCGACGNACPAGLACQAGVCVPVAPQVARHCGADLATPTRLERRTGVFGWTHSASDMDLLIDIDAADDLYDTD